ncbi:hypothetical protein JL720_8896 [Aureococcus anophagefferens]|nr:hypothetical protein JL720_8896 [Aureococcus anophagefferens]
MEKSLWQAEAELSRFDDDAHRLKLERGAYASDLDAARAQNVVISHKEAFYAPDDPRADWSGMVPSQGTRKAVPGAQGARMHIERTEEGGIVAAEEFHERLPGGKKHWEADGRFQTESQRTFAGRGAGGFGAPGGDGAAFVTSSQLAARASTDREFFGSSTKRRGKKQPHRSGSLAGYRSRQFNAGAPSMLSTAASGIAHKVAIPDTLPNNGTYEWAHKKGLFDAGNYRAPGTIVGYTGRRAP